MTRRRDSCDLAAASDSHWHKAYLTNASAIALNFIPHVTELDATVQPVEEVIMTLQNVSTISGRLAVGQYTIYLIRQKP